MKSAGRVEYLNTFLTEAISAAPPHLGSVPFHVRDLPPCHEPIGSLPSIKFGETDRLLGYSNAY